MEGGKRLDRRNRRKRPMKYWRQPLDKDRIEVPKGKIRIIEARCKGCKFCIEFCPRKVLEQSTTYNEKGYHPPVVARQEDCIACGFCELVCPDFAIFVEETSSCQPESIVARPKPMEVAAH
jgi:2-oxoglutarate ferredoxin oxidoreductase subunit delta